MGRCFEVQGPETSTQLELKPKLWNHFPTLCSTTARCMSQGPSVNTLREMDALASCWQDTGVHVAGLKEACTTAGGPLFLRYFLGMLPHCMRAAGPAFCGSGLCV